MSMTGRGDTRQLPTMLFYTLQCMGDFRLRGSELGGLILSTIEGDEGGMAADTSIRIIELSTTGSYCSMCIR